VHYKLRCKIDLNGVFSRDLYAKQPLVIHPRLGIEVKPATAEQSQDVMVCCCFNQGHLLFKTAFDKNAYVPGETAQLMADVQNDSKKPLNLMVKLHRMLVLTSGSGYNQKHQESNVVAEMTYPSVAPGEHAQRPMPLFLPTDLKPTSLGQFVNCTYRYTVEAHVSWGSTITCQLPVVLYAPQPPNWAVKPLF